jgi:OmpA-OmpF porin, OOP family
MRSLAGLAALVLLLLTGCARPVRDDLYVLLPGPEGQTGQLRVESGGQATVLEQPYGAARVKEPGRVEPTTVTEEEARQAFGPALAAQPDRPMSFLLYFLEARDELTPESQQTVAAILGEIAKRPAPEIVVIGHTDRVGSVPYNDALSLRRAERVRDELVKAGVPADRIRVAGRGEREPLVPTPDEVAEPRNRRVEINLR